MARCFFIASSLQRLARLSLLAVMLASCGGGSPSEPIVVVTGQPEMARTVVPLRAALPGQLDTEKLFRWAQVTYPALFPDSPPIISVPFAGTIFSVRPYASGNFLGVADGRVYGLGPFTSRQLTDFGAVNDFAAAVCAVVGCGDTLPDTSAVYDQVQVGAPGSTPVIEMMLPGGKVFHTSYSGRLSGNLPDIASHTIYVIVEDPSGLFESTGMTFAVRQTSDSSASYTLQLVAKPMQHVGRYTGNLRIFVCLDSAECGTRVQGTPIVVPYDVTVADGCTIDRDRIELTVPFGTTPAPEFIHGTCSAQVRSSSNWSFVRGSDLPFASTSLGSPNMAFTLGIVRPGIYRETMQVRNDVQLVNGSLGSEGRPVEIIYTVLANDLLAAPAWTDISDSLRQGEEADFAQIFRVVLAGDYQVSFVGIDYLTHPSVETDVLLLANWLTVFSDTSGFGITDVSAGPRPCRTTADGSKRCLAAGVYTASARFRVRDASRSVTQDVSVPYRLQVLQ
jgi:hypothetical protein